jgi:alkanesulfonate monooxygenase SsuD/methylene tetrahydromethanopterin reductase-like flavin-dependent oxidoreductase (luciferase family)
MSDAVWESVDRTSSSAIFNDNKFKLGIFGLNCDSGAAMTTAEERLKLSWPATRAIAVAADRAGYELLVPISRWLGLGGPTNFEGKNFETYTWAAGIAAATDYITIAMTSHVQVTHPIFAAKQAVTVDHISNGRAILNIVCGWFLPELEMFGAPTLPHDLRYDYAQEWFDIVRNLWTRDEPFDYHGKYFQVEKAVASPKPFQRPTMPTINAGGSGRGQEFVAANSDVAFALVADVDHPENCKSHFDKYRTMARANNRDIQIWTHGYVIQRETEAEAQRYFRYITEECGNDEAAEAAAYHLGVNAQIYTAVQWQSFKGHLKGGYGGCPFIGTAEQIAEKIMKLSKAGLDGLTFDSPDYLDGISRFNAGVLPLLEQMGLRKPYAPKAGR